MASVIEFDKRRNISKLCSEQAQFFPRPRKQESSVDDDTKEACAGSFGSQVALPHVRDIISIREFIWCQEIPKSRDSDRDDDEDTDGSEKKVQWEVARWEKWHLSDYITIAFQHVDRLQLAQYSTHRHSSSLVYVVPKLSMLGCSVLFVEVASNFVQSTNLETNCAPLMLWLWIKGCNFVQLLSLGQRRFWRVQDTTESFFVHWLHLWEARSLPSKIRSLQFTIIYI